MSGSRELLAGQESAGERLDRFLAEQLPELTRSQVKRLIDDGLVSVAGVAVKAGLKLRGGETIGIFLPEAAPVAAAPEAIPLAVLYEDPHLIVIDKPAHMVVHPAPGHRGGTLVNALLHHCQDLSGIGGALRPGIVHRLDKDTSGVMVATKDDPTHQQLARQFKAHTITRRYRALVHGLVQNQEGTIDRPIGRHPAERLKMSSSTRRGRRAVTHWQVLRRYDRDRLTLLDLALETGRTHQIRVHLAEMNLPVVGDPLYGSAGRARALADPRLRKLVERLDRQFLHAWQLGFVHPQSGQPLEFRAPLPPELQEVIDYLEQKYAPLHPDAAEEPAVAPQ
ncbi:MAG: RluA family pseudouridine synthase [Deltaproteobacteria bacterium]|nr:MAG: RluA family pseudouridine synthase [Deltaproteobacteria bacterium]